MTKYIFVTGGVVSGLGKGITAASLGRLLKCRGYKVASQKLDPYINIDPGTMSPYQHGEVFVTEDGAETDLDLGHYERFIDENLDKNSNVTTGKIYWSVLQKERRGTGAYHLVSPKNGKSRRITPAKTVMEVLRQQRQQQTDWKRFAGESWEKSDFVFTDTLGHHFSAQMVYLHFKKLAAKAGYPDARFHDLRHSYAVAALQSGDDIKTVQENLGHHTAAFTLDVYGHVTDRMKQASADRMEGFIKSVSSL